MTCSAAEIGRFYRPDRPAWRRGADRREEPAQRDHADFLAQRLEIGADEAVGVLGDLLQVDVRAERHRARVNPENLQPRLRVRDADLDLAIEAPGPPQRRIEHLREYSWRRSR